MVVNNFGMSGKWFRAVTKEGFSGLHTVKGHTLLTNSTLSN